MLCKRSVKFILATWQSYYLRPIAFRPCFTASLAQQNMFKLNKISGENK